MKNLLALWLFFILHQVGYATEYIVTNMSELQDAHDRSVPGDYITLRGGNYAVGGFTISHSGSANGFITYRNYAGEMPKFIGQPTSRFAIVYIIANYIRFEGIEIQGINQYCSLSQANKNYVDAISTNFGTQAIIDSVNKTSCNGLSIGSGSVFCHHVEIRNCISHDNPGQGMGAQGSDYITFEGNTSYNNCWYSVWGSSGINIHTSTDLDPNASDATSTKNYVIRNRSYNNKSLAPYIMATGASASNWFYSDGNGIIIDLNQDKNYKGATLVANNICYNNGGAGINVTSSSNISILHNSTYCNGLWLPYAELLCYGSQNLYIYNNIFYAKNGGIINKLNGTPTNILFDYNIYYNGVINNYGPNDKRDVDPQYADQGNYNFKLSPGSQAINTATYISWITTDIDGTTRPIGSTSDRGAYEYSGSGARIGAEETSSAMKVVVLGNPIKENVVRVKVSGVGGQPVQLRLTDIQGRLVSEKRVEQALDSEEQQLPVDKQRSGMLLLQVSTGKESQTIKVLRQ